VNPARAATVLALLVLLPTLASPAGAQVALPEGVTGSGTASRFYVEANGASVEGGLYERTITCRACFIRLNLTAGEITASDGGGAPEALAPGVWEIRGFVGTFAYTQEGLGVFDVDIEGAGGIHRVS
jgi:hypothetical protein